MILLLYKAKKKPNRLLTSFHQTQQRHRQRAEISTIKILKCATATTARVRTNKPLHNRDTDTALWERERERERKKPVVQDTQASVSGAVKHRFGKRTQPNEEMGYSNRKWSWESAKNDERERERGQDTRGSAHQSSLVSPPSLSLSLSLLARLSSLPLAGLFAVDGDGRWRSRCRSLPGDYNCLPGWMNRWIYHLFYD
jgi:hypothetical protein